MSNDDFLILRAGEAEGLLTAAEAIEALEEAWREQGLQAGGASSPAALALPTAGARFTLRGVQSAEAGMAGFTLAAEARGEDGASLAQDWLWLAEAAQGRPQAMIEMGWLRALQAAAAAALAARLLAPAGIGSAALLGVGPEATLLPAALAAALPGLRDLRVVAAQAEAAAAFRAALPSGLPFTATEAASPAAAVAEVGLVVLAGPAEAAALRPAELARGTTVVVLGDRALPAALVSGWAERRLADDRLSNGAAAGPTDVDLAEVAAGLKPARQRVSESVLAVLRGTVAGDLALATLAWRKARLRRLGIRLSLGEAPGTRLRGPTPRRNRWMR